MTRGQHVLGSTAACAFKLQLLFVRAHADETALNYVSSLPGCVHTCNAQLMVGFMQEDAAACGRAGHLRKVPTSMPCLRSCSATSATFLGCPPPTLSVSIRAFAAG